MGLFDFFGTSTPLGSDDTLGELFASPSHPKDDGVLTIFSSSKQLFRSVSTEQRALKELSQSLSLSPGWITTTHTCSSR